MPEVYERTPPNTAIAILASPGKSTFSGRLCHRPACCQISPIEPTLATPIMDALSSDVNFVCLERMKLASVLLLNFCVEFSSQISARYIPLVICY